MACNGDCRSCVSVPVPAYGCSTEGLPKAIEQFFYDPTIHATPTTVFLGVTARCNLACPYCFVNQHNSDMTLETAINACEMVIQNIKKTGEEKAQIVFFGGEPLLMFDEIMKPIIEKYSNIAEFTFTTNATLLDEDKVDFFRKYDCIPLISLDGVKEVQDKQRPGKGFSSFDRVLNNIPYILFRFPMVTMRATVTKDSLPFLFESYEMGKELGFRHFSFCVNTFEQWTSDDADVYKEQMDKIGEDIYRSSLVGDAIHESTFQAMYEDFGNVVYNRAKLNNEIMKCGMGTYTMSVTPDGKIVPCQEKISNPTWIIGDVNNGGYDYDKHREFLIWYLNKVDEIQCPNNCTPECKKFCLQRLCSSRLEDIDFKLKSSLCLSTKTQMKIMSRIWYLIHDSWLAGVRESFSIKEEKVC